MITIIRLYDYTVYDPTYIAFEMYSCIKVKCMKRILYIIVIGLA